MGFHIVTLYLPLFAGQQHQNLLFASQKRESSHIDLLASNQFCFGLILRFKLLTMIVDNGPCPFVTVQKACKFIITLHFFRGSDHTATFITRKKEGHGPCQWDWEAEASCRTQKTKQNNNNNNKKKPKSLKYQSRGGGPSCLAPFKKKLSVKIRTFA